MQKVYCIIGAILLLFITAVPVRAQTKTKLILLGTGTPNADPDHSGCSVAVVVGEKSYIVDFGPGLVRKAAALTPQYGSEITALNPENLVTAFLTHLHSDHTAGLPDFILTPWVLGRDRPIELYGPRGTAHLISHLLEAYSDDIKYRVYGLQPSNDEGWRVNAHEFTEGEIYRDSLVTVEAFKVKHGSWPNAFGFRFITPDKKIVISGDTTPSEKLIQMAKGADILLHEVYSMHGFLKKDDFWKRYHKQNHTSTYELAEIANIAKPGKLILYHILFWGSDEGEIRDEITKFYDGEVIVGRDLMIID